MDSATGQSDATEVETDGDKPNQKDILYWKEQVTRAKQELERFHSRGSKVVQRYLDIRDTYSDSEKKMNIFWANVGILKAALYANPPQPTVTRQFQDPNDDEARVAAEIMERMLSLGMEMPRSDIDTAFQYAVQDRLIPGLGQVWFRYVPQIEKVEMQAIEGVEGTEIEYEQITDEAVKTDYVHWKDFLWSPARTWEEVTWAGRCVKMTKRKATARFGKEKAKLLSYKTQTKGKMSDEEGPKNYAQKVANVYEIWDKEDQIVLFISDGCDKFLDRKSDPLGIRGFFPFPCPLTATNTTSNFTPQPDYYMVRDQYAELDKVNTRINYLTDACKVVGVYDKNNEGVQTMLQNGIENQLIPVDNWSMFAERGGLQGQIDWLPVEQVVIVLEKLRQARLDVVAQLYELTGISDIMRGVSAPRETATAQNLKAQYSSSRLQFMQEEVARFCQEGMRIKADIMARHFQPDTLIKKSNIMRTPDAELAQGAVKLIKDEWESLYRLEIEADKLAIPDYNLERQSRMEYATAVGQMLGQSQAALETAPQLAPFVLQTLQWVAAGFRSGRQMEGVLDQAIQETHKMLQAQQGKPDPAQAAAQQELQMEQQKLQMEQQAKQAEFQMEQQMEQQKFQAEELRANQKTQQDIARDNAKAQNDIRIANSKALASIEESAGKSEMDSVIAAAKADADIKVKLEMAELKEDDD